MEKYTAIKVVGINHWLWFENTKITRDNNVFIGNDGWGRNGALTSIKTNAHLIEAEITSDTLQY